jgi:hypothetical protein
VVVQGGHEISPEETVAATEPVCEPADSSVAPLGIPIDN